MKIISIYQMITLPEKFLRGGGGRGGKGQKPLFLEIGYCLYCSFFFLVILGGGEKVI